MVGSFYPVMRFSDYSVNRLFCHTIIRITGYSLPEDAAEGDGEDDKGPVPLVIVVDGGHAEEHEDDRLGRAE